MSQKHMKSILTAMAVLAFSGAAAGSSLSPDAQGMQKVIHSSGVEVTGKYIAPVNDKIEGPVSIYNLFSLQTEACGTLDFQAGMMGVICTNCQQNTAVMKGCSIPRNNAGWKLSNG